MGSTARNDWQSQPRDRATGRFLPRQRQETRSETIRLRVTPSERAQIERAANQAGQTLTSWLVAAAAAYSQPDSPMDAFSLLKHIARKRR